MSASSEIITDAGVTTTCDGGVAVVELRNVAQRNALTRAMCRDLVATFRQLATRDDIGIIVLRGAGGTFCSGIAITELRDVLFDDEDHDGHRDHLSEVDRAIRGSRALVVAAVDGFCFGGGWQLASACDFVIASAEATFAITPSKLGIIYPRVGMERLVRQVGAATAKYLLATGDAIDAPRAREYGLISVVTAPNEFESSIERLISTLTVRSRFSISATKQLIDAGRQGDAPEVDALWALRCAEMENGPDIAAGIAAFTAHERPAFPSAVQH